MPTSLLAIANKARKSRKHRFQNLYHRLNIVNLRTCFYELKKDAAPGVDKVDWQTYETNLEENLRNLNASLRAGSYHACGCVLSLTEQQIWLRNYELHPVDMPI